MEGSSEVGDLSPESVDKALTVPEARQKVIELKDFSPGILKTRVESLAILTEGTIDNLDKQRRVQYGNFALGIAKLSESDYNTDVGRDVFGYFYRRMNVLEEDLILKTNGNKNEEEVVKLSELRKEIEDTPLASSNAVLAKIMELNTQTAHAYGGGITFAQELEDNYRLGGKLLEPMPEDAYKAGAVKVMEGSLDAINKQAHTYFQREA